MFIVYFEMCNILILCQEIMNCYDQKLVIFIIKMPQLCLCSCELNIYR